jgi:hypothetical protein
MGKRGQSTYRKRDLRIALEAARPGDKVEVDLQARKIIITVGAKAGEANGAADVNPFDREAEKLRKQAEGRH